MNINLMTWYANREMDYCPKHFVQVNTHITDERHQWILENLKGRYYIGYKTTTNTTPEFLALFENTYPYFEDPQEAVIYELKFS